jgi:hypothetical protein
LKSKYYEDKDFHKENPKLENNIFSLEWIRDELRFKNWIESKLKPMFYSEKQYENNEIDNNAIMQNWVIENYTEIWEISNFDDYVFLWYGITNKVLTKPKKHSFFNKKTIT